MNSIALATVATTIIFSTNAHSALVERLGGLAYYDTEANLTWLADANYAMTSAYVTDGRMNWVQANTWAAGLDINGVTGWRLPDTVQPDTSCDLQSYGVSLGYNCTGSELGNMFYNVLGGVSGSPITVTHNAKYGLFSNIQSFFYWSATEYAYGTHSAWGFNMNIGGQGGYDRVNSFYAWAVHSGDISAVPVPAAVWLFGSGLLGLMGVSFKRKH